MSEELLHKLLQDGVVWVSQADTQAKAPFEQTLTQVRAVLALPDASPSPVRAPNTAGVVPFALPAIDDAFPQGGLRSGAIHEWCFVNPTAERSPKTNGQKTKDKEQTYPPCSLPALLAGNALRSFVKEPTGKEADNKFVIWIGRTCWPTPYLLRQTIQHSGPLSRCIFIDPPDEKLRAWAVETALRSHAVAAVIAEFKSIRFSLSRRFELAAEKGGTLGLFIRSPKDFSLPSAAASRWRITTTPSSSLLPRFELELVKCKGQQPELKRWIVELVEGDKDATLSLRIPSDVAIRTNQRQETEVRQQHG